MILFLALYAAGMLAFALWDAYIGYGVEFDGQAWPPVPIAYGAWPITLAATIVALLGRSLQGAKDRRIKKSETQKRIRIAAEKEEEALMAQIESEMLEDEPLQRISRAIGKR